MSKVLVIGDLINDQARYCQATRLCPEAPVPVLVQQGKTAQTDGGAGLVVAQLSAIIGEDLVAKRFGSLSVKERIFADGHLQCRLDRDRIHIFLSPDIYEQGVLDILNA